MGEEDTLDQGVQEGGHRGGTEGGRGWLDCMNGMNGLTTI